MILTDLPDEILAIILSHLPTAFDRACFASSCLTLYNVALRNHAILMGPTSGPQTNLVREGKIPREAVTFYFRQPPRNHLDAKYIIPRIIASVSDSNTEFCMRMIDEALRWPWTDMITAKCMVTAKLDVSMLKFVIDAGFPAIPVLAHFVKRTGMKQEIVQYTLQPLTQIPGFHRAYVVCKEISWDDQRKHLLIIALALLHADLKIESKKEYWDPLLWLAFSFGTPEHIAFVLHKSPHNVAEIIGVFMHTSKNSRRDKVDFENYKTVIDYIVNEANTSTINTRLAVLQFFRASFNQRSPFNIDYEVYVKSSLYGVINYTPLRIRKRKPTTHERDTGFGPTPLPWNQTEAAKKTLFYIYKQYPSMLSRPLLEFVSDENGLVCDNADYTQRLRAAMTEPEIKGQEDLVGLF